MIRSMTYIAAMMIVFSAAAQKQEIRVDDFSELTFGTSGVLYLTQGSETKVVVDADEPLSIEVWNTMDVDTKYEFETLEHLRSSDPKLKSEAQWNRFMKEVVVPQRRIDIPTDH